MKAFKGLALAMLLGLSGLIFGAQLSLQPLPKALQQPHAKFLYVVTARSGELKVEKDNHYKLILRGVNKYVTYFSNRPKRISGLLAVNRFVNHWDKQKYALDKNPPNGNIQGVQFHAMASGKHLQVSVELLNPHYDPKSETLAFQLIPLKGAKLLGYNQLFGPSALFIDNMCLTCTG